nr:reverse transcriptase domain-containing protein [Tanacetum cinerariifolium]
MIASGNPTPYYDPIVSTTSSTLTPFGESDFVLEEVDAVDQSYFNTERDILLIDAFLNDDPSLPPPNQGNYLPQVRTKLKICEAKTDKSSIDEPFAEVLKILNAGLIYLISDSPWKSHFMVKEGIVLGHKISKNGIKVDKSKVEVIAKLPHPTTVKGENRTSWSDKLDDALWAFRTAYKTLIGCTPYKLVYEKACHLPVKLEHKAYWALKHVNFDLKIAGDHRKIQINELNELRDQAYENSLIYEERIKKIHDSKIKNRVFNIGDRVLLYNSRLRIFSGKLKSRWSGPFTISQVFPYGAIELSQPDRPNFKVNGHRLKHYFREDIP